jgi:monoamine oxidase
LDVVPPLPAEQRDAIAAVRYGRATKVAVQTTCGALRDRRAQAFATDTALGAFWDATDGQPSRTHSMINFLAGGAASSDLQRRAAAGAASVLRDLCWLGLAGAEITGVRAATWEEDPFARGGYAFLDPGFRPAWRSLLSRPAGRLFFAGEHTSSDFQGYMEGAVRSGTRAAAEVLDAIPHGL